MQPMNFDLRIEQKYCIHCAANNTCAMSRLFSYAEQCDRYPNGPGFTRDDKEYKDIIYLLWGTICDKDSYLNKQLQELKKLAK